MAGMPSRATLLRWVKEGRLTRRERLNGVQREFYLLDEDVFQLRGIIAGGSDSNTYESLLQGWREAQRNGSHTGKPLSPETITNNDYGLKKLWATTGERPRLEALTVNNVRRCFEIITEESGGCGYALKEATYKAVLSFRRHLERVGVACQITPEAMKTIKPRRAKPAKREIVREEDFWKLLQINETQGKNRTPYDRVFTRAVVCTMARAGLRKKELLKLAPEDVHLGERPSITVKCGKGGKRRRVGICKTLLLALQEWEMYRPKRGETYFCNSKGRPASSTVIRGQLDWLENTSGIPVGCHALRRTFAVWADQSLTRDEVEVAMGHARRDVTSLYIIIDEERLIDKMNALL